MASPTVSSLSSAAALQFVTHFLLTVEHSRLLSTFCCELRNVLCMNLYLSNSDTKNGQDRWNITQTRDGRQCTKGRKTQKLMDQHIRNYVATDSESSSLELTKFITKHCITQEV